MTDDRVVDPEPGEYVVAFTPRQVGGFVLIAALLLAFARWLRRPRGKV